MGCLMPKQTADPPAKPWERQPDETANAYQAFVLYRDLGVERSTSKVAAQLGKSKNICDRWSTQKSWVERVHQWDTFIASERDRGIALAARDSGTLWQRRRIEWMEADHEIACLLQTKAREIIQTVWLTLSPELQTALKNPKGEHPNIASDQIQSFKAAGVVLKDAAVTLREAGGVAWGVLNAAIGDEADHAATPDPDTNWPANGDPSPRGRLPR